MDAGEILSVFCHHFEDVIRSAGHQVTLQHIRDTRHCLFERIQHFIRLPRQGNLHKYGGRHVHLSCIQQCNIVADVPFCLQPLHPPVAGRGRQVHPVRQIGVGNTALLLKHRQNATICFV